MDTDAIRRAWPDVLGRVFQMRRITWTFVSQNAQVTAFDGTTLTLGIATEGLTNTFRSGNHAEIVRQALIDQLGIDAVVDGVHLPEGAGQQSPVTPPPATSPPPPAADERAARTTAAPGRSLEANAGWGSVSQPAPDWATSPSGSTAPAPTMASRPSPPDSAVSDDDEVIELSADVGRGVIEKVLGGRVISEVDE